MGPQTVKKCYVVLDFARFWGSVTEGDIQEIYSWWSNWNMGYRTNWVACLGQLIKGGWDKAAGMMAKSGLYYYYYGDGFADVKICLRTITGTKASKSKCK